MKALEKLLGRGPSDAETLARLLEGYRSTALLYVAAALGIADRLADGPRSSADLAAAIGADAPALLRVLRALAALGICNELAAGSFELAPLGAGLRSGAEGAARDLAILNGAEYAPAWNQLLHSVFTGGAGFEQAFGESPWRHREKNPALDDSFHAALAAGAARAGRALAAAYDFSALRSVADLGGGRGTLLAAILEARPALEGLLFDRPAAIAAARRTFSLAGLDPRCRFVEGDFFREVPAGADVYILKSVLHDWNDAACLTILKNCRAALQQAQPLLVIERILPERALDDARTVLQDVHMLAVTGGRERTADEFARLFAAAGFAPGRPAALSGGHTLWELT